MSTPRVSVLIATFNRASYLPRTLGSVFEQTLTPHEVILVDDGSTDDTQAVVASLTSQHPAWASRLVFIRQDNQGKSAALNRALPLASGEWIAFNDSDDTWMPEKLERQFEALARFPDCAASFTETTLNEFADRHPELTASARDTFGRVDNPSELYPIEWPGTYMQTVLVRADVMRQCGDIDSQYRLSQDVDFLFRLGLLTPFCYVNAPLVAIDRTPDRHGLMTHYPSRSWTAMLETDTMLSVWLPMVDDSRAGLRRTIKHALADSRSALANRHLLAGDLPAARRVLRKGLSKTPELRLLMKLVLAYAAPVLLSAFVRDRAPVEFLTDQTAGTRQPSNGRT